MKMTARTMKTTLTAMTLLLLAGCSTIYTRRDLGPQQAGVVLTDGLTVDQVIAALGAPDVLRDLPDGATLAVYKSIAYMSILGIYVEDKRSSFMLTFRGGGLTDQKWVPTGEGMSIIGYQMYGLGVGHE
jgi:uncharacterized protein YceK